MLFSPRSVSAVCIYALIHILGVLFTYHLASLFQMLFSPRSVSAACIYALIHILGVLFTYRLASLFQMLFSLRSVSAACTCTSIYVFGVLFTYRLTEWLHRKASSSSSKQRFDHSFICIWVSSVLCILEPFRIPSFIAGRGTPFDRIPRPHSYVHTDVMFV
jgi:xanthosine utilization system XapX-like protein